MSNRASMQRFHVEQGALVIHQARCRTSSNLATESSTPKEEKKNKGRIARVRFPWRQTAFRVARKIYRKWAAFYIATTTPKPNLIPVPLNDSGAHATPFEGLPMEVCNKIFSKIFIAEIAIGPVNFRIAEEVGWTGTGYAEKLWRGWFKMVLATLATSKAWMHLGMSILLAENTFYFGCHQSFINFEARLASTQLLQYRHLLRHVYLAAEFRCWDVEPAQHFFLADFIRTSYYHNLRTIIIDCGEDPEGWWGTLAPNFSDEHIKIKDFRKYFCLAMLEQQGPLAITLEDQMYDDCPEYLDGLAGVFEGLGNVTLLKKQTPELAESQEEYRDWLILGSEEDPYDDDTMVMDWFLLIDHMEKKMSI